MSWKSLCALLLSSCLLEYTLSLPSPNLNNALYVPQFRYDYSYIEEVDGWYKIHEVPAKWHKARNRCQLEGAELATPLNTSTLNALTTVMQRKIMHGAFTGIHAIFNYDDYYSIKGIPLARIPVSWAPSGPSPDYTKRCVILFQNGTILNEDCDAAYPYICTKHNGDEKLGICGTTDRGYIFNSDLKTCYKFHASWKTWDDAFTTCSAEGGHLLVINNYNESNYVFDFFKKYSVDVVGSTNQNIMFVGVIDWEKSGNWVTIHGDTLEESGFSKWKNGRPSHVNNNEFCGTLVRSGGLNNARCTTKLPFICEKKLDSLLSDNLSPDVLDFLR